MLADNMKKVREALHWSQRDLSDATGITQQKVSRLERGADANQYELLAIAGAFKVTVDFLLTNHGDGSDIIITSRIRLKKV